MTHLPKHLRPRWRYLAVGLETWPGADIDRGTFQRELWYAAQNLVGDAGSADLDGTVLDLRFEDGAGEAVVRARRGQVERLRAVLATVDEVDGCPLGVYVRGVSGTVRACEEKYLRRPTPGDTDEAREDRQEKYIRRPAEETEERSVALDGADRPAVVRGDRVDARLSGGRLGATALDIREN